VLRIIRLCLIAILFWACPLPAQVVPTADRDYEKLRKQAFVAYEPSYAELRAGRIRRAAALEKRVFQMEAEGQNVACAHQILNESKWLLGATADFEKIDQRLDSLESVLRHPDREAMAMRADPSDGSWGACYTEWFFRLDATYDHFDREDTRNRQPEIPLRLLDRVNSPEKLRAYFEAVSTSDIAKYGVDHRRELNESMADLMRFILQNRPAGYPWDPRLKLVLMDIILRGLRNPDTGWWGERYLFDGQTQFVDYLSLTFHIVRYLDGNVPDMRRVVQTTLDFKDLNEPAGWLSDGQFTDHNNMDVAVLFRFGWNSATTAQKQAMREQIQKLLDWCLRESLQPDGSFAHGGDDSVEEDTYFGATFLTRIGFFDADHRFWTEREFPEASEIRERIIRFITQHQNSGAAGGTYYESALRELNAGSSHAKP
jgi:hypothetical protein